MFKILYMEDNGANLRFMQKALKLRDNLELLCAETAVKGIELAQTEQPDLILLDIQLPELDGYAVFKRLRENALTKNIPVIAVSANAMAQDIHQATQMGFDGYITKPVNLELLFNTIDSILK